MTLGRDPLCPGDPRGVAGREGEGERQSLGALLLASSISALLKLSVI